MNISIKRKITTIFIAIILITLLTFSCVQANASDQVYVGGDLVGFSISHNGVLVGGFKDVQTESGAKSGKDVFKIGDLITQIDGVEIKKVNDIALILDKIEENKSVNIQLIRNKEKVSINYVPLIDRFSSIKKLGVVAKDCVSGLGTTTFVSNDGTYVALGHGVCDNNKEIQDKNGTLYNCVIGSVVKGEKGKAGAVSGYITSQIIGNIENCTKNGIYGKTLIGNGDTYQIAKRDEVKCGKAKICSTISGIKEYYDIEIIRAVYQKTDSDKGLIIKITDKRLLDLTGGIVQGMSGSPIIQNDKIIGAVTHVFINDPTRGYGIYLENMLSCMNLELY